ncbi:MAG TPA: ferritin-like domain-containing protein [Jatrophihabitantaceae bacterium]
MKVVALAAALENLAVTAYQGALTKAGKGAKSVPDVAKLALALENAAAETYTFAAINVKDIGGIMTAAAIQPVETMHAAILSFVLGEYPVPVSFIGTTNAVQPNALTA